MNLYFSTPLPPSPVSSAFTSIQHCPLEKVRLTSEEQSNLLSADENPLDYTLADAKEAYAYVRVLLKVLAEASISLGSSRVSRAVDPVPASEAMSFIAGDPMGVMTHYSITKLYDVIVCLLEKKEGSAISVGSIFYHSETRQLIDDYRPLLRVLHLGGAGDLFAQRGAARCLALILLYGCDQGPTEAASVEEPLQALVLWALSQLQSSASTSLALVSTTLTVLLSRPEARSVFQSNGGVGYISRHLRSRNGGRRSDGSGATAQQLYELCFCLWTLTYELNVSTSVRAHFARDGAVPALVNLVATAPREKVTRVALSALRNLAMCTTEPSQQKKEKKDADGKVFLAEMIGCGLIKSIDVLKDRQWTDPDIVEDLDVLHSLLHENFRDMTRWDVYKVEVETGTLEWGVVHTEAFFQEHAKQLEGKDGDFRILKTLIVLAASEEEDIAAIACFDIGEFARNYPGGRLVAKRLGAKDVVMKLIDHENPDLRRQALLCVSKLMVQNWQAMNQVSSTKK